MFALLEKQTASLRKFHPKATMWVSPQGFTVDWMDQFYDLMAKQPAWLTGSSSARRCAIRCRAAREDRQALPDPPLPRHHAQPARQYPVPDWDLAYALTSRREPINPRPLDETAIFRALDEHAIGFITYSEGCNDDVNKIVWSAWAGTATPIRSRRCASTAATSSATATPTRFAQGLLALERNWRGPLASNAGVDTTLQQFQAMERRRRRRATCRTGGSSRRSTAPTTTPTSAAA